MIVSFTCDVIALFVIFYTEEVSFCESGPLRIPSSFCLSKKPKLFLLSFSNSAKYTASSSYSYSSGKFNSLFYASTVCSKISYFYARTKE